MTNHSAQLVSKLWNYCNILRDDGLSYGDYVEQLTYLLFLKMADEQSRAPFNKPSAVPKGHDWPSLMAKDGDELETHYRHVLEELGKRHGLLGVIFRKAQNKIQDPAKLRRLIVDLIDKERWSSLSADVKGDAYEGLLQKNAEDVKGGAGQPAQEKPWTEKLWIYDLRTNLHFTLKENTLKRTDLDDFVACYFGNVGPVPSPGVPREGTRPTETKGSTPHPGPLPVRGGESDRTGTPAEGSRPTGSRYNRVESERFKSFTYEELLKRDKVNLDIFWLKDEALEESANPPAPEIIAQEISDDLEAALEQFTTIAEGLKK